MSAFNTARRHRRHRPVPVLTAATVAAVSALVLIATAPARANVTTSTAAGPSSSSGDVLFWARSTNSGHSTAADRRPFSIVRASADAPSLVATVLSGTASASFEDPEVSPDGSKLAYINDGGIVASVEVRDLATGSTTVLVRETDVDESYLSLGGPTWSPDGESIAFVDYQRAPEPYRTAVKVVGTDSGLSTTVDDSSFAAAWRPDGRLTVARWPANVGDTGLWITGATPDDAVLIAGTQGAGYHVWSPDGALVAFDRNASVEYMGDITTVPAAGGTPTVINTGYNNSAQAWSSDGQQIYFSQNDGSTDRSSPYRIMRVPRTGGTATRVAEGGQNFSPSVTTKAAAPVPSKSHDFNGDGYADVIGRMSNGDLRVYDGTWAGLSGYRRIGTGWSGMTAILTPGDFDGDHHPDVIGRLPNGELRLYTGVGGGPAGSQLIGTGWGGMTAIFSPGDFTGDGHPDVIARTTTGELRLYFGTGTRLSGYRVIGTGWNAITAVFSPGDFNGDHHPDVIGRTTNGDLRLYAGTGTTLSGSTVIGTGWNGLSALFSPGDFTLDGRPDVIGRLANGDLRVYYGTGTRLSGYRVIGTGWNSVNPIL